MNPKESSLSVKYRSLSKAYRSELKKINPDRERMQALDMEIKKMEDNPSFQDTLNLIKK